MIWDRFRRDETGNMAILFAVGFTVSAFVSALAVDAASLYHERRQLQAGVDLAAISAASDLTRAAEIAQSVLVEARLLAPASTDGLTVVTGHYDSSETDIAARFEAGASPANAVSVTLRRSGQLHFAGRFANAPTVSARGVAAMEPQVSFSLGSRLASLNGGIANALLAKLLGTTISLSVMDYRALVDAKVDALALLDALAFELGITAGTYDDILAMDAPAGDLAKALASLTTGAAKSALHVVGLSGVGRDIPLGQLMSLGDLGKLSLGSSNAVAAASISAMDVLSAAALLADGDNQVALNLGAGINGLAGLNVDVAIGEPLQGGSWFAIGSRGTVLRTAQLRMRLKASILGSSILLGAGIKLPVWLDLAHSEAQIAEVTCPTTEAPQGSAKVDVRPGALRFAIGEMDDIALRQFGTDPPMVEAKLVDALLLKVFGSASVSVAADPVRLNFSSADIATGTTQKAMTRSPIGSLTNSLFANLQLTVRILGLGLSSPSVIAQAVRALIAPVAPTLDLTVNAILSALGLGLGEAEVRVYGVRCGQAVLVG